MPEFNMIMPDTNSYEYYVRFSPQPYLMSEEEFIEVKLHENDILYRVNKYVMETLESILPRQYKDAPIQMKLYFVVLKFHVEQYSIDTIKMTKGACLAAWLYLTQKTH